MVFMLLGIILYVLIWFVPVILCVFRRKSGKKPYYAILVCALILEVFSLYVLSSIFKFLNVELIGDFFSLIISMLASSYFYWKVCVKLEEKTINKQSQKRTVSPPLL